VFPRQPPPFRRQFRAVFFFFHFIAISIAHFAFTRISFSFRFSLFFSLFRHYFDYFHYFIRFRHFSPRRFQMPLARLLSSAMLSFYAMPLSILRSYFHFIFHYYAAH